MEWITAPTLAARLRALGFDLSEGIGRTGIVGLYRNRPAAIIRKSAIT
jgi:metal-dependent amidase/aminoacylase/carboxypeptidase family protein